MVKREKINILQWIVWALTLIALGLITWGIIRALN